ncbi:fumarylacetoacetate hydrolase family protein [Marinomonas mediterranea]|uniref:Fumarylacetoacetate (FAA) hydrolase n=1 Tax=Marinomonas mediterranea (strain ATCC 700492 / JCM 21426 / NBRC 103028 / MMB-1) TaxID=717774 RepID=F2JZE7_MARM1|nr:fumarylacetoacetate hydrolase family protein [Marinomonas mediterranea]ADZ89730.1 fumarylacetoacetate (FAA) hydrolase [Marinomonas mediterranea MMB-1]WCN15955.1 fumarylacetoacetate hydrolase [Marinomonas mediterranea MMB-1]
MKFATLKNGHRDGSLVLVSRDLNSAVSLIDHVPTMQCLMETWAQWEAPLEALYQDLNDGNCQQAFAFDSSLVMAPLPRSYQWCDASAFLNHGELLQKAFNLPPQAEMETIPLMYQGAADDFLGARDDIRLPTEDHNIDFEGEFAVMVDDVPMGCSSTDAAQHIKLILLLNDVSLRGFIQREIQAGFGFLQAKPSTSFAPVAVTPDELVDGWRNERVCLPLNIEWNAEWFGSANGEEMNFSFSDLIAHAALTRKLGAGTIVGSGTVSNRDTRKGSSCIAERRALDMIQEGKPKTPFMSFGDRIRMEACLPDGGSVFGAIDQYIVQENVNV